MFACFGRNGEVLATFRRWAWATQWAKQYGAWVGDGWEPEVLELACKNGRYGFDA